uniref:Uncharacterized protein n=1 Tax=Syphacia muris TaxID=451379 RepID=A0A0N5AQN5_9BILA
MSLPSYNAVRRVEVQEDNQLFDYDLCPSSTMRWYSAFKNAAKTAYWMGFRAMLNVIPLSMILVGLLNYDGCPIEPYIPRWLIWMGILLIIKYFIDLGVVIRNVCIGQPNIKKPTYKAELSPIDWIFAGLTLMLYLFGIAGFYWVLKSYGAVQYVLEGDDDFCDEVTYTATFVIIAVVTVILFGLTICSCLCFGILYWEDKRQPESINKPNPRILEEQQQHLTTLKNLPLDSVSNTALNGNETSLLPCTSSKTASDGIEITPELSK